MQPQNPNPDFDFMFKDKQSSKKSLLPSLNLPKPAKIGLAIVVGLIILTVISSLLSGRNKGSTQAFIDVLARGQETQRVTQLVQQQLQLQDPQTTALAATVSSCLASDTAQITSYLSKNHIKVNATQLAADKDPSTDANMQTASQNNNLDSAYVNYLKGALGKYETDLQTAYKSAGPNGKQLLQTAFGSTDTLLTTPPLKS